MNEDMIRPGRLRAVADRAQDLARTLERMRMAEYVELLHRPGRLIYLNFLAGLARGLGIAVGFSLLGALALYWLQRAVMLNLPVIGTVLAELVGIIQNQLAP